MPDWHAYVRERLQLQAIRPEYEQDIVEDLAGQLEEAYGEAIATGLSPAEATVAATAHVTDWRELARQTARSRRLASPLIDRIAVRAGDAAPEGRHRAWLFAGLAHSLRVATRLQRHRGYFALATMTLTVAVGVNLVVFTAVNALWFRPLPFPDADRLVTITGVPFFGLDAPMLEPFEAVAGQVWTSDSFSGLKPDVVFDRAGRAVETLAVTPEYFGLFGLHIRGRDFTTDDDRTGAEPVAIISDRLWSRAFERRPDVIGAVAAAKPFPIRIIGVAPADFEGARRGERADVWIPSHLALRVASDAGAALELGGSVPMMVFARLSPGQTPAQVTRRLLEAGTVDERTTAGVAIVPLKDVFGTPDSSTIVIREGKAFGVVAGLALLVLAGGCATLAALVLVHYERRRRELAVRIALGASRGRLAGELSLELGVLAIGGTIGAVLLAVWGLRAIPSLSLPGGVNLTRLDLSIDWRVVAAAAAATAFTLVAAAFLPISRFTRPCIAGELVAGPVATASAGSERLRRTLLGLHVAATIVVLIAAGLFVRAVVHGFGSAPGFDTARTVFAAVRFPPSGSLEGPDQAEAWRNAMTARATRLREALRSVPGVEGVAVGMPPIDPDRPESFVGPRAVQTRNEHHELRVGLVYWSAEWLDVLGVPILAGRGLTAADATTKPTAAVVTASLARRLWPAESPLGQPLTVAALRGGSRCVVVGIARDFVVGSLTQPAAGVIVAARQTGSGAAPHFVIRTAHPETMVEPIRRVLKAVEPDASWLNVTTGREIVARDLGRQRLGAWFFSGFGLTALLLGVAGVFGLVAYLAESRQREFGVRVALGAAPRDLVRHGLGAALVPVSLGVAAGLLLAAFVGRLFTSLLTGLSALDPLTYVTVALTMLGCAGLAGLGAAWRLRRVMPTDALRAE